jgi:hypothetical protein
MIARLLATKLAVFCCVALLTTATAWAQSPTTTRNLNNINIALGSIHIVEAFRKGPIPPQDQQRAKNVLADLDSGLGRAQRDYDGIPTLEKMLPACQKVKKEIDYANAYRADLQKSLGASQQASAVNREQLMQFREDTRQWKQMLSVYRDVMEKPALKPHGTPAEIAAELKALEAVDKLCTEKYQGLQDDKHLSIQMDTYPGTWCRVAAQRKELARKIAMSSVQLDLQSWQRMVDSDRTALQGNQGFPKLGGKYENLLKEPEKEKAALLASYTPYFEVLGETPPADLLAPLSASIAAWQAELERLAPTWTWPADVSHDKGVEAIGAKWLTTNNKGAKILKIAMLSDGWTMTKNSLGIPVDRYRTGLALYSLPAEKWCRYQEFTVLEPWISGTTFQKANTVSNLSGERLQACK